MRFNYWLNISISFFIIAILMSIKQVSEFFYNLSLNGKADFFLTLASINATFFAIFFSIILIAVQHSASNYLPSILSNIRKDSKLIFITLLSSLGTLFSLFIYLSEIYSLTALAIILFLLNFLAIIFYFYEILNFVNPLFLVSVIKDKIIKKMQANKHETIKQVEKEIRGTFLEKFSHSVHQARLNGKDYGKKNVSLVDELFNHVERSRAINDPETYNASLNSLYEISDFYLKNKGIDSQQDIFIEHILTKLKLHSDSLLNNKEHFKVIEIIKVLELMAESSLDNLQILNIQGLNYMTALVCHYIEEIGIKAVHIPNLDLAKECLLSLKKIGIKSTEKNLNLNMTEDNIKKITLSANDWFIYHHSISAINILLDNIVKNMPKKENAKKIIPEYEVKRLIKIQGELLQSAVERYRNSLEISGAISPFFGFLSEVRFSKLINRILWLSQNPPVELATRKFEEMSKEFIEEILNNQKKVIDTAKKYKSNMVLIDSTNEFLEVLNLLINTELKTYPKGFKEELDILKGLILANYIDDHTHNMLKLVIKNYKTKLDENKKSNKSSIIELNKILKELE